MKRHRRSSLSNSLEMRAFHRLRKSSIVTLFHTCLLYIPFPLYALQGPNTTALLPTFAISPSLPFLPMGEI